MTGNAAHMSSQLRMGVWDWCLLVALAFSWGCSFALNEVLLRELSPFSIVWIRQLCATLLFLPIALPYLRRTEWSVNLVMRLIVTGIVAIAMPFSLFALGQQSVTSILAGIGNGSVPLFTMLIAYLWMADERINSLGALGLIIGFSGVFLLFLPMIEARDFASIWGFSATVFASLMYGFTNVFLRTLPVVPVLVQAMMINLTALIVLTPLMLWEQPDYVNISPLGWAAAFAIGTFCSFFAYILYLNLIRRVGSVNTSQVAYIIPFAALMLGLFALGEEISFHAFLALGLVLLGLWIKDRSQKISPAPPPARDA